MTSIAFLVGNASYDRLDDLPCCLEDLEALTRMVEALGRYDRVVALADADAEEMRSNLRTALDTDGGISEILFYFSGHGGTVAGEYYYCGTGYDRTRPNQTALSESELNQLFREASPSLLVKILDACESGTRLVKDVASQPQFLFKGLQNVVQLASSLNDQESFGGERLSRFTQAFCRAVVQRETGPIFYSDIINSIRDEFLEDDQQTPFFVSQGTARERLVDDASRLAEFRLAFQARWDPGVEEETPIAEEGDEVLASAVPSPAAMLAAAEASMATPERAQVKIASLFDGVIEALSDNEFGDLFELERVEHDSYREVTTHDFVARTLAREPRHDRFVTAEVRREKRPRSVWETRFSSVFDRLEDEYHEVVDLELNCKLERAQVRITLTPKYKSLQRFVLVLTCAPSLDTFYVFELLTRHPRTDWSAFAEEGRDVVRRWYRLAWDQDETFLVQKIRDAFVEAVQEHVSSITGKLDAPGA